MWHKIIVAAVCAAIDLALVQLCGWSVWDFTSIDWERICDLISIDAVVAWLLLSMFYRTGRKGIIGMVLPTGIKRPELGKMIPVYKLVIPFESIDGIKGTRIGPKTIRLTDGDSFPIYLSDADMFKLAHTRLNQWYVKSGIIGAWPGGENEKLRIAYTHEGRNQLVDEYDSDGGIIEKGRYGGAGNKWDWDYSYTVVLIVFLAGFIIVYHSIMALLFLIMCFLPSFSFEPEDVFLTAGEVVLVDHVGREEHMAMADVADVERGFYRTKVAARDGRVLYFTNAYYLLHAFIREFAGLGQQDESWLRKIKQDLRWLSQQTANWMRKAKQRLRSLPAQVVLYGNLVWAGFRKWLNR